MSGPDPAVAAVRGAVRAALRDLSPGDVVLVGCSGGADSLALAAATGFVAPRAGLKAGAVVVDHGWLPTSAEVARGAAGVCRELGLDPVEVVAVTPDGRGGPEASARTARYAALEEAAGRHAARAVLVGHTRDDQAETVLLGLLRGAGARSLAGMPAVRGVVRRPLLDVTRATTRRACAALGLDPWEDPANADPRFARSRLRAVLARFSAELDGALGGDTVAALARTAQLLADDADALEAAAAELLRRAGAPGTGGSPDIVVPDVVVPDVVAPDVVAPDVVTLDVERLAGAPAALRRRALLLAARSAGSPAGSLGRRHVLAVDALLTDWHGQGPVCLPGGVEVSRACGRLLLGAAGRGTVADDPEHPRE